MEFNVAAGIFHPFATNRGQSTYKSEWGRVRGEAEGSVRTND